MASPYNPPKKNEDFKIRVALEDTANSGSFKLNPTLAAGDVKGVTDAGVYTDLGTLPVADGSGKAGVLVTLSATEMNNDVVFVQFIDQTVPKEWADYAFSIPTTA